MALMLCICTFLPSVINGNYEHRADFRCGDGPHWAELADFDDDGDMDIVTVDYYSDAISVLLNDGEGFFTKKYEYQAGDGPRSLFVGDIDNDGDYDVVSGNYHDDSVSVFKNHGNGSFAGKVDYKVDKGPYSIFLTDIGEDSNCDLDIISADEESYKVSILKNNGNGIFSGHETYTVGDKPKGVFVDDVNGDGHADIACANWASNSISVLINKGDGTFKEHVEYDSGSGPRSISLADLNGDGIPDIACANQFSNNVSVLLNNGDGTFASKIDYAVGTNPINVHIEDFDDDKDKDILTVNLIDDSVSILKNQGNGVFGNRIDYSSDNGPYRVILKEVNGDGKIDIITVNNYADSVSVRYSNSPPHITITEPDGEYDIANNSYTVTWEDFNLEEDAEISLFWDGDDTGFDGAKIVSGLSEDDNGIGGAYAWNISDMPEGDYWVYAKIDDGIFDPKFDYSAGPLTINHSIIYNTPPTFQIVEPDGEGDFADIVYTIMWMDSDPDDDATISLYYDLNANGFDGTLIIDGLGEDENGQAGFYNWNTTAFYEGHYYIYGICDDGFNQPVRRYSAYPVNINHTEQKNDPPQVQILEPDGEDDFAHTEYMITWSDSDPDDDAHISLYYDSNNLGLDGFLIVDELSEDEYGTLGYYIWNTTQIPEGNYWIYAKIEDESGSSDSNYSLGPITIDHFPTSNARPSFQFTEPDGISDFADSGFVIMWIDSDPDDNAAISLYYDADNIGFDGTAIIQGQSEDTDGNLGFYLWNTSAIPDGKYFVYCICEDGKNEAVKRYSQYQITVNHTATGELPPSEPSPPLKNNPPLIQLVEPDGANDIADTEYMIRWIDSDADDDASISLYYDDDNFGYDGTLIIKGLRENQYENSGIYVWDTFSVLEGEYYIYAVISDGFETSKDYSSGKVKIDHSGLANTSPRILLLSPGTRLEEIDRNFTILWIDSDSEDDALISLFYDSDQGGYDGTLIISGISENDEMDCFCWDTKNIPEGEYYIYATIDDGLNDPVYDYSDGKIYIKHETGDDQNEDNEVLELFSKNPLLFLLFVIVIILVLAAAIKKKRKIEDEEELEDIIDEEQEEQDKELFSEEDLEDDEIDEDLLPPPEDLEEDEIDEDLLPPPEEFENEKADEDQMLST